MYNICIYLGAEKHRNEFIWQYPKKLCEDISKKNILAINEPELVKEFFKFTIKEFTLNLIY